MPRDGANVYTLPEAPFTNGTIADAPKVNNNYTDIAAALTDSVCRSTETTATGRAVMDAADAAAARSALSAPAVPVDGATVGQWQAIASTVGGNLVLPAGGNWAYFAMAKVDATGALTTSITAGVDPGGTTILTAVPGWQNFGFCWRIA